MNGKSNPIKEMIILSLLGTIIFVLQTAMSFLPNIEPVSFLLIIYTLILGKKAIIPAMVFNMLIGILRGMGTWWLGYLIIWPLLVLIVLLFKDIIKDNFLGWSILSGIFGFVFGVFYALPQAVIISPSVALAYFIRGIPYDLVHMVGNYFIMLVLGKRMYDVLSSLLKKSLA
ncbi:hypothetical protein [Clostridium sp.]|uniref:hypothetical protein n=1 Tax=Clostridium sp. TaxID=1506 RepID=UPI003463C038